MTLKNLDISTDTLDSMDLLLSPLQESGLKQLIINYHSNKVREVIADNTDEFSVFHYEETKLINEIGGIGYWSVRDIGTYKSAVINSNKEFIIPFGYYNYIEKSSDNPEYICCRQGNNKLLYDYKGNLIEGSPAEYISEYREKFIKNKYAQQVVEEIKKQPLSINKEHIYRLKSQIKWCEDNFEIVKQNTKKMEMSSVKHSVFDYSHSMFSTSNNKRFFSLKDKNTEKYGLVNAKGELITPFIYDDWFGFVAGENDYMLACQITGGVSKYGLLDCMGQVVVEPISDILVSFYDGLALIKQNGKYGYINTSGDIVIPVIYDKAEIFEWGKAEVELNGEKFYINRKGEKIE